MNTTPFSGWVAGIFAATLALTVAQIAAQPLPLTPIEGFHSRISHQTQGAFRLHGFALDRSTADLYLSIDNEILRRDSRGRTRVIVRLPRGTATGLFGIPVGSSELLYTNFRTHEFCRHDLRTGVTTCGPGVKNAFDAVVLAPDHQRVVLLTANPVWPGPGAETGVFVVGLPADRPREIIRLAGPSGPLVLTANGDLLCALLPNAFPPPPGSVRLVRFTAAQVQAALAGTSPLPLSAGTIVMTGLDGAYDLAIDDRQRLYLTDPHNGGLVRTRPWTLQLEPRPLVQPSGLATLGLAFVDSGPPTMDGYQPSGATMWIGTTDWNNRAEVRRLEPRRPSLSATPNPSTMGPLRFAIEQAPANARVWLGLTLRPRVIERPQFVVGGVSLYLGLDLRTPPILLGGSTDQNGSTVFRLSNPGGLRLQLHAQALIDGARRAGIVRVATSNPLTVTIQP